MSVYHVQANLKRRKIIALTAEIRLLQCQEANTQKPSNGDDILRNGALDEGLEVGKAKGHIDQVTKGCGSAVREGVDNDSKEEEVGLWILERDHSFCCSLLVPVWLLTTLAAAMRFSSFDSQRTSLGVPNTRSEQKDMMMVQEPKKMLMYRHGPKLLGLAWAAFPIPYMTSCVRMSIPLFEVPQMMDRIVCSRLT